VCVCLCAMKGREEGDSFRGQWQIRGEERRLKKKGATIVDERGGGGRKEC
jgi:hypothetical protein